MLKKIISPLISRLSQKYPIVHQTAMNNDLLNSYFTLFESMPDPIMLIKGNHFINCNKASLEQLNYPDKVSFLNLSPWEISPKFQADGLTSNEKAKTLLALTLKQGYHRFDWQHLRYDGSIISVEVTLTAINLMGESLFLVAWRDIGQHLSKFEQLQKAKKRLKVLYEANRDAVMLLNEKGFIECNPAALTMFGFANQESFFYLHPSDLSPEKQICGLESRQQANHNIAIAMEKGSHQFEWLHKRIDTGEVFPTEVILTAMDIDGDLILHAVVRDITQRKQTEDQLSRLSIALEQSASAVVITDLNTRIEYVNQAFINSTGYSREEIIGQKPSILKSGHTPQATYDSMWAALDKGEYWQGELVNKSKQGQEFIHLTWISPIQQTNGTITHYLSVKEDITERKKNEVLLILAKERAEKLLKTKSQFLANMSHEIRTPMNAIIGFSELALLKDMPAEVNDYLKNINTASNNLLTILNDILDLSKLEAGKMGLNLSTFSVHNLHTTLHNLFINAAKSKGLVLNTDIASNVPEYLIGDNIRLRQVLTNLLGNAIKFTHQGEVTLSISLQQRDDQQARLLFAVTDTGIGISAEQQNKLFLPFSQVDDGYARNFEGTGLGLVISQDLVQLMDSAIKVESKPSCGSCFSFELALPIAPLSTVASIKSPLSTAPSVLTTELKTLNDIKILVAEDDIFNQKIIEQVLTRLGASLIIIANDGSEALRALEQDSFDIVLMDLHMPIMNGFEAATEIRKRPHYAQLPVIALSASVTNEDRQRCLAAGMNDFIGKPINVNELLSTLDQWLQLGIL